MSTPAPAQIAMRLPGPVAASSQTKPVSPPRISPWLLRWFSAYAQRHLRRHFHAVRLQGQAPATPRDPHVPLVLFLNHASWWDPLVCLELKNRFFPERMAYAPIDAAMLGKYRFFQRLGFFGVEQKTRRGAAEFLHIAQELMQKPGTLLALTPQSQFVDVRQRPVSFAGGIGHLAARVKCATFIPLAIEYVFWQERFPEVLVHFGRPIDLAADAPEMVDARAWTSFLEQKLAETQDALATSAQNRKAGDFQVLLAGRSGAAAIYDLWRAFKAKIAGQHFHREHAAL